MNIEDKILEILKHNLGEPIHISHFGGELNISDDVVRSACGFLEKYGLVRMNYEGTCDDEIGITITRRGLQLLNLPDLPEDELPSDQLGVLEKHRGDEVDRALDKEADLNLKDKTINLYSLSQHTETANWIDNMAIRYDVRGNDVICALWTIAKDSVWAKLEQDVKEKKRRK